MNNTSARSMVVYVDGSSMSTSQLRGARLKELRKEFVSKNPKQAIPENKVFREEIIRRGAPAQEYRVMGWSIVACVDDRLIERAGCVNLPEDSVARAIPQLHEQVAFMQGVTLAQELGIDFSRVSLFCDDDLFGYAPSWIHPDNYLGARAQAVIERVKLTITWAFSHLDKRDQDKLYKACMQAFNRMRIVKLKGHVGHAYQERADYLAKRESRLACRYLLPSSQVEEALSFDAWLTRGLRVFDKDLDSTVTMYLPFTGQNSREVFA